MEQVRTDIVVIGGGMAGLPIANKLAYKGKNVIMVEKELLGGTCLNRGCIPTKTMVHSAKIAHTVRTASAFGIHVAISQIDLPAVVERKNKILGTIRDGAYRQVDRNAKLTLIEDVAEFEGPGRLRVGEKIIKADQFVINTGARPRVPPVRGLDSTPFHTSRTLLDLTTLPKSMIVLGGGYIGVEFAQMFARFGSKITVLQKSDRLVPNEDPEISDVLLSVFRKEEIEVILGADVVEIAEIQSGVRVSAIVDGKDQDVEAETLLVSTGRIPNTDDLGLKAAGVDTDAGGSIVVDDAFRTSQAHIWAIGDVTGRPMFTHSARDDAQLLYEQIIKRKPATTRDRNVPYAIFTDPEIAAVGMTEAEAREKGFSVKIGKHSFARTARARAIGSTAGFVKIVADAGTDRLLGAQIIGPSAGELIHELVVAIDLGASYDQISRSLHVHPTLSEAVNAAAGGVHRPAGDE